MSISQEKRDKYLTRPPLGLARVELVIKTQWCTRKQMERLAGSLPHCYRLSVAEFAANVYFGGNAFIFYLYDVPVRLRALIQQLPNHN